MINDANIKLQNFWSLYFYILGCEIVESWYSEHKFYPFDGLVTKEILLETGL